MSTCPFLQLNRRNVRPLGFNFRWSTDFTQIPIAADSRDLSVFLMPFRSLTVFFTFLIHRQKRAVCDSFISRMAAEFSMTSPEDGRQYGYKSDDPRPRRYVWYSILLRTERRPGSIPDDESCAQRSRREPLVRQ